MTYAEKLKDQRWQKKRLELLELSNWTCACKNNGTCLSEIEKPTLHVHHKFYMRNTDPWGYPVWAYSVLCELCHDREQEAMQDAHAAMAVEEALFGFCVAVSKMSSERRKFCCEAICEAVSVADDSVVDRLFGILRSSHDLFLESFKWGREKL